MDLFVWFLAVALVGLLGFFVWAKYKSAVVAGAPGEPIPWGKTLRVLFQYALGAMITAGFFFVLWSLLTKPIPPENSKELDILLGALVGAFTGGVVGYFFGTSMSSSEKNDIIAKKLNTPDADPPEAKQE